ncbi:ChaN family lipoprotein [Paracoccus aestuariivivens]|uniref:Haem-binding uptake Tiki superfamily ChaN domain-containing protein n=1 Tax=Paracoccus aestuariivivens TaxID=1820333 RepID=A0A6L6JA19_9RHOB|nr:ChaN family lipoprotein [Paracoccus aestuariivivens]MTH78396.1 hypothetical protein [Paracoccus aestuariivivens]
MTGGFWVDHRGERQDHPAVIARAARSQVVLLGERHDRADHHRWQLHVAVALAGHRPVTLGFEMFPARVDPVLADWVAGKLSEDAFLETVGWSEVWGFPAELYLPLFRFCREMGIPMVGLNVRRELVRNTRLSGWDNVADDLKEGLTRPRPSPDAYRNFIFDLTRGARSDAAPQSAHDPAFDGFLAAQEVWDRAFATRLARIVQADPARLGIGIIGMGHLQFGGGVSWQLKDLGIADSFVMVPRDVGDAVDPAAATATWLTASRLD